MDKKIEHAKSLIKISKYLCIDGKHCSNEDKRLIIINNPNVRFLDRNVYKPYKTKIIKNGNSYGIGISPVISHLLNLRINQEVQLILDPFNDKKYGLEDIPNPKQKNRLTLKYQKHFRFPKDFTLADINFGLLNKMYYIPIFTKLANCGNSQYFPIRIGLLKMFGFKEKDIIKIIIISEIRNPENPGELVEMRKYML